MPPSRGLRRRRRSADCGRFAYGFGIDSRLEAWGIADLIEAEYQRWSDFADYYRRQKRRSGSLREADGAFRKMHERFVEQVLFQEYMFDTARTFLAADPEMSFANYTRCFRDAYQEEARVSRDALIVDSRHFVASLSRLSMRASATTLCVFVSILVVLFVVVAVLVKTLSKIFKVANARLEAQDRLARQQAHEMRNKFSPALFCMEAFVESARKPESTAADFRAQEPHMAMALVALREVEAQHQARLDVYKILCKNYVARLETFGLVGFVRERVDAERAISRVRARSTNAREVEFRVVVGDKSYADCGEIYVRTDLYVLNHVINNLLSNARKFTFTGSVVVTLLAERRLDGLLVFAVRDTGIGLPQHVIEHIFRKEVATGGAFFSSPSSRLCRQQITEGPAWGSSPSSAVLNLASALCTGCPVAPCFARQAAATSSSKRRACKTTKRGSATATLSLCRSLARVTSLRRFEFAVAGTIVEVDRVPTSEGLNERPLLLGDLPDLNSSPPRTPSESASASAVPNDLAVVVVDDSDLNRTCLVRGLKRVQKEAGATGWSYVEFETVEAAQPYLLEIHEAARQAVVCLDVRRKHRLCLDFMFQEQMGSRGGVLTGLQGDRVLCARSRDTSWQGLAGSSMKSASRVLS